MEVLIAKHIWPLNSCSNFFLIICALPGTAYEIGFKVLRSLIKIRIRFYIKIHFHFMLVYRKKRQYEIGRISM